LLAGAQASVFGAMADYCQAPPYISAVVPPNVMLALDVSGSMGYDAYKTSQEGSNDKYCSNNSAMQCDDNTDCSRKYCSLRPSRHCHDNTDCNEDHNDYGTCTTPSPATGTCALPASTAMPYGYCSNSPTTTCEVNSTCGTGTCIPRMTYEGYFIPSSSYILGADSVYREYTPSGTPCTIKYTYPCKSKSGGSCPSGSSLTKPADALNTCSGTKPCYGTPKGAPTSSTGDCGTEDSGNLLNYRWMSRIDLLRWAMTGGSPTSCTSSSIGSCDPRVYNDSGNQATGKVGAPDVCRDDLKLNDAGTIYGRGCVLLSDTNKKVAVPWSRISEGLVYEFDALPVKPRMGAMFYSGTTVRSNHVYVGDFTAANSRTAYTFQNLLTEINATDPSGYTPTGPALWDVFNYFKQTAPEYGGIPPSSSHGVGGDDWKNPLYDCPDGGGGNCNYIPCTKSFVMLMSDGLWNQGGGPPATNTCSIDTGYEMHSADPVVPSYLMHKGYTNVKGGASGVASKVTAVYTVGLFVSTEGEKALQNTAIYGSFDNTAKTWPSNRTNYPGKQTGDPVNCAITTTGAACPSNQGTGSNCNALPASSLDWDKNADGVPDTFFYAEDALTIRSKIMDAINDMLSRVASGTAASVLASGEGSGANLIQSVFYPRRPFFEGSEIGWTSTLQNLWYYIDPRTANSSIRENTADRSGATAQELNLTLDNIVNFYFDPADQKTKAKLFADANGDGSKDSATPVSIVDPTDLKYLWEAGLLLWNKTAASRAIYTPLNTGLALTNGANAFTTTNLATIRPKLNTDGAGTATQNNTVATNIINYVRGTDQSACDAATCGSAITYRTRTGAVDLNKDGDVLDTVNSIPEAAKVWKLGDMINATPKIASWVPLNNFDTSYADYTYTTYTKSSAYTGRGMVFAGANDGMLHAFKLGTLGFAGTGFCSVTTSTVCTDNAGCPSGQTCNRYELASLSGSNLGNEEWAFIPSRALPYLQYLADPDYCHLYTVDTTPVIFDASFNKPASCIDSANYWDCAKDSTSWRTVLIGGMRLGGACKAAASTLGVQGPTATAGEGYSSYFALDITNPSTPTLLWEFAPTDGSLGFATSGPAVMKINARIADPYDTTKSMADKTKNGRWFVVFASGPTGPIEQSQFKGYSNQNLKLFVLDLATGSPLKIIDTELTNAFGGSLTNAPIDYDFDYQDDAMYLGYTRSAVAPVATTNSWTTGGVLRLVTNEDLNSSALTSTALYPENNTWSLSTVMSGIGPVTASVGHLAHYAINSTKADKAYLYFGTGRYFFNSTSAGSDDPSSQRKLYGIVEPCLANILTNTTCTSTVGALTDASSSATPATSAGGWF
ncbi:MAG: PilC/PilY family type IV pilus protein, partial [Nitrospirota bacterium]|nr:PilC/PilY family type IV pilus protein [Nitrospirota bacterium]